MVTLPPALHLLCLDLIDPYASQLCGPHILFTTYLPGSPFYDTLPWLNSYFSANSPAPHSLQFLSFIPAT
jgi:hypothetical protein